MVMSYGLTTGTKFAQSADIVNTTSETHYRNTPDYFLMEWCVVWKKQILVLVVTTGSWRVTPSSTIYIKSLCWQMIRSLQDMLLKKRGLWGNVIILLWSMDLFCWRFTGLFLFYNISGFTPHQACDWSVSIFDRRAMNSCNVMEKYENRTRDDENWIENWINSLDKN